MENDDQNDEMRNLSMMEIFSEITNHELEIVDFIPPGPKDNTHYFVYHSNKKKFQTGRYFTTPMDDTGTYVHVSRHKYEVFQIFDGNLKDVTAEFKYEIGDKTLYRRTNADTLRPVTDEEYESLILVRSVCQKKEYVDFSRKITYFLIVPPEFKFLEDVCLIEYVGLSNE